MADIRRITLELLLSYEREERYVNLLLSTPSVKALSREDRGRVTSLLYTTVENKLRYDYYISSLSGRAVSEIDTYVLAVLRLGISMIADMSSVPDYAAVNECVKLGRQDGERKFINAVLRRAVREKDSLPMPKREKNEQRYLSVRYSLPKASVRLLAERFGERRCEAILKAFSEKRGVSLTVNTKKISAGELLSLIGSAGISAVPSEYTDNGIIICEPIPITEIPGFDEGYFFVQDEASRIMGQVLSPREGDTVIDTCSAPGGKAFAAAIKSGGRVYAFDLHETKLSLIKDGAARLGLDNLSVSARDATEPCRELFGTADRVICDVPCSGLGVIGKKPDLRYKDFSSAVRELVPLQSAILEASSSYLKVGGMLVYSTCTLTREECEGVSDAFVESHPNFVYEDFSVGELHSEGGKLLLAPDLYKTDGFYISLIKRIK